MPRWPSDTERFWAKVDKNGPVRPGMQTPCWVWTGYVCDEGYGRMKFGGQLHQYVHRISWQIHFGPVPERQLVCHRCDYRICIRPDHFFAGSIADNNRDMMAKARHRPSRVRCYGSRNGSAKVSDDQVATIRARYSAESAAALAEEFGLARSTIRQIANGTRRVKASAIEIPEREVAHG